MFNLNDDPYQREWREMQRDSRRMLYTYDDRPRDKLLWGRFIQRFWPWLVVAYLALLVCFAWKARSERARREAAREARAYSSSYLISRISNRSFPAGTSISTFSPTLCPTSPCASGLENRILPVS